MVSRRRYFPVEFLEQRTMLSATLLEALSDVTLLSGATQRIDLYPHFADQDVNGVAPDSTATFVTSLGNINVQLDDQLTPDTVENFAHYADTGEYDNTIIHQSANLSSSDLTAPVQFEQGGGFKTNNLVKHIPTIDPIGDEASLPNIAGTLAMARLGDADSATSEWFFNVTDNSQILTNDPTNGEAVFGATDTPGQAVLAQIAAVPRQDQSTINSAFTSVPVDAGNYVVVQSITLSPRLTFSISSDNPNLVTAAVTGNSLTLTAGPTDTGGIAHITITGTAGDDSVTDTTFAVNVNGTSVVTLSPTGATTLNFTDADGTATRVIAIGGTAQITLAGMDLSQTTRGRTVTITGTPASIDSILDTTRSIASQILITARGGDGAVNVGTVNVTGSLGAFNGAAVALSGDMTVSGTIALVRVASATGVSLNLDTANLAGPATNFFINVGSDLSVSTKAPIGLIRADHWVNVDTNAAPTITAPAISTILATGDFTENVTVTRNISVVRVGGSLAGTAWTVGGNIAAFTAGTVESDFLANVTGNIGRVTVTGNLTGTWLASIINVLVVNGNIHGLDDGTESVIAAQGTFTRNGRTLGTLIVKGAIDHGLIFSNGNIGLVRAASLSSSKIYAGVNVNVAQNRQIPAAVSDFSEAAKIAAVQLLGHGVTFSSSLITASLLGPLSLGVIQLNNNAIPFGIVSDQILSIAAHGDSGENLAFNRLQLKTQTAIDDQFTARQINRRDFEVELL